MTSPIPDHDSLGAASDDLYDDSVADAWINTPVKVPASRGVNANGPFRPLRQIAAQFQNAILFGFGSVVRSLRAVLVIDTTPIDFTAASTLWTCPPNVYRARLQLCGGGGGGGGGGKGSTLAYHSSIGGGAGSGAPYYDVVVPVVPGTVYQVIVGDGGAGGAGATATPAAFAVAGSDGSSSIFRVSGGAVIMTALGGRGGGAPLLDYAPDYDSPHVMMLVPGGSNYAGHRPQLASVAGDDTDGGPPLTFAMNPGDGGDGCCNRFRAFGAHHGVSNLISEIAASTGFRGEGGSSGGVGASDPDLTGYIGGGSGGGGGGGPFCTTGGCPGGDGGAAHIGAPGAPGGVASDADLFSGPNSGGGGGGGGGGGSTSLTSLDVGIGGRGGRGGSGRVRLTPQLGGWS